MSPASDLSYPVGETFFNFACKLLCHDNVPSIIVIYWSKLDYTGRKPEQVMP